MPNDGSPAIVGETYVLGIAGTATAALATVATPASDFAVTLQLRSAPASAAVTAYVPPVATWVPRRTQDTCVLLVFDVHVPVAQLSVLATPIAPTTDGGTRLSGSARLSDAAERGSTELAYASHVR